MLTRPQTLDRLLAYMQERGVLTTAGLTKHDPVVYRGVLAHLGSIAAARDALGISRPSRRAWSESRVINELRQLHRGRVRITTSGLRAAGHYMLISAVYRFVGSIGRARRLARIPKPGSKLVEIRERWDEDRVIGEIRARRRAGSPLGASQVPSKLYAAARSHCGSWQAAVELADLNYDQVRLNHRPWTPDDILAWIKRAARKHIRNPDGPTMTVLVAPIGRPMREFFGNLEGALQAANLDPGLVVQRRRRRRRSEAELVEELRAELKKRSVLKSTDFFRTRLGREAVARFGSWRAVIDRIGPDAWIARRNRPLPTPEELIAGLQARHRRGAIMALNPTLAEEPRLAEAARKHFGSWRRAMEAAGFANLVGRRRSQRAGDRDDAQARQMHRADRERRTRAPTRRRNPKRRDAANADRRGTTAP